MIYTNIIDFIINNKYVILYLSIVLAFFHFLNVILEHKYNRRKNETIDNKKQHSLGISICIIMLFSIIILSFIPIIKYIVFSFYFLFNFYMLIITPLFNKRLLYNYKNNATIMSSILLTETLYFINFPRYYIYNSLSNDLYKQIYTIAYLLILIFLIIYVLLLNNNLILHYLSNNLFQNIDTKIMVKIKKNNNTYDKNSKDLVTINSLFKTIKFSIKYVIFIIFINSILFIMHFFITIILNLFKNINEQHLYRITKIAVILSIIIVYFIIQIYKGFNTRIITIYEFCASTIIIPLLLDGLLKNTMKKFNI